MQNRRFLSHYIARLHNASSNAHNWTVRIIKKKTTGEVLSELVHPWVWLGWVGQNSHRQTQDRNSRPATWSLLNCWAAALIQDCTKFHKCSKGNTHGPPMLERWRFIASVSGAELLLAFFWLYTGLVGSKNFGLGLNYWLTTNCGYCFRSFVLFLCY